MESPPRAALFEAAAETARERPAPLAIPWGRLGKLAFGLAMLAFGIVTTYQQLFVSATSEAVINARLAVIRAPIDGVVTAPAIAPGIAIAAGAALGRVTQPHPDDSRLFALRQQQAATARERDDLRRRLADLKAARAEASAQADAYRQGRVHEDELRVEEAQANLQAAAAREADATAAVARAQVLHDRGFVGDAQRDQLQRAQAIAHADTLAAQKRLDALRVELAAARAGTFLGDSYNDAPSSLQRARELSLRIAEGEAALARLATTGAALAADIAAEQTRLEGQTRAVLAAPVGGRLWSSAVASGEYVRQGQDLYAVLDCTSALVTATVAAADYNRLSIGEPVSFRVAGSGRTYRGHIVQLGLSAAAGRFAIAAAPGKPRIAAAFPGLAGSTADRCAVGRTGTLTFEGHGGGDAADLARSLVRFLHLP